MILSLDIGSARMGYCIMEKEKEEIKIKEYGIIKNDKKNEKEKILGINNFLEAILEKEKIKEIVFESLYLGKNKKSFREVSMIYGIVKTLAYKKNIKITEINPKKMKKLLIGKTGGKKEIENRIREIFGIKEKLLDDVFDAIGIGYTYLKFIKGGDINE